MCVYKRSFNSESMVLEHCTVLSVALIIYVPVNYEMVQFLKLSKEGSNVDILSKLSSFKKASDILPKKELAGLKSFQSTYS